MRLDNASTDMMLLPVVVDVEVVVVEVMVVDGEVVVVDVSGVSVVVDVVGGLMAENEIH